MEYEILHPSDYGIATGLLILSGYGLLVLLLVKALILSIRFCRFRADIRSLLKQIPSFKSPDEKAPARLQGFDKKESRPASLLINALKQEIGQTSPFSGISLIRETINQLSGQIMQELETMKYIGWLSLVISLLCTLSANWKSLTAFYISSDPIALRAWASGVMGIIPIQAVGVISLLLSFSISYFYRSRVALILKDVFQKYLRSSSDSEFRSYR